MLAIAVIAVLGSSCGDGEQPAVDTAATAPPVVTTVASATANTEGASMELTSPAFDHETEIPFRYTCDGDDLSPELRIAGIPDDAVAMALIMDDPDAPVGTWDHWVAYDFAPTGTIPENVGDLGTAGLNSWKQAGYGGPCPPSGTHRYFFRILALDGPLGLGEGADKAAVLAASEGHVLAEAILMGTFDG